MEQPSLLPSNNIRQRTGLNHAYSGRSDNGSLLELFVIRKRKTERVSTKLAFLRTSARRAEAVIRYMIWAVRCFCELLRPTALGPARPSLVAVGASCFCVGPCIRRGHSGSRLRRRRPFTGGSECPTPTSWTLGPTRRCALLVALEHRRRCGEHRTTLYNGGGSKPAESCANSLCGRCIPSLLRLLRSLRGGRGLSALTTTLTLVERRASARGDSLSIAPWRPPAVHQHRETYLLNTGEPRPREAEAAPPRVAPRPAGKRIRAVVRSGRWGEPSPLNRPTDDNHRGNSTQTNL